MKMKPLLFCLLSAIRVYRLVFSSISAASCRFYPTCSHYAEEALIQHGVCLGFWLTLKRLSKCHPWGSCGIDFVPGKLIHSPIDVTEQL